jgi:dihydropteroate synthase
MAAGIARDAIVFDPGIGFGKRLVDNLALLSRLDELAVLGFPLLVGLSRKSFIGAITGRAAADRLAGSLGAAAAAWIGGARLFRVHDVASTRDLLLVLAASRSGKET